MSENILQQLDEIQQEASAALASASTTEETRAWHREYLGGKGRLTGILRGMGRLSAEERPLVGKRGNEVKVALESALEERQSVLALAELEAERSKERVDVTLPGRPQTPGKIHPTTRVLREISRFMTHPKLRAMNIISSFSICRRDIPLAICGIRSIQPIQRCCCAPIPVLARFTLCASMRRRRFA